MALAITLLLDYASLLLAYLTSTLAVTIITFFLKKRLYALITTQAEQAENANEKKRTSWKVLLISFLMMLGFIVAPLLLAGVLGGTTWFVFVTSLISGVSISEIVLYVRAHRSH
jgi:nitrate reductase NapE component